MVACTINEGNNENGRVAGKMGAKVTKELLDDARSDELLLFIGDALGHRDGIGAVQRSGQHSVHLQISWQFLLICMPGVRIDTRWRNVHYMRNQIKIDYQGAATSRACHLSAPARSKGSFRHGKDDATDWSWFLILIDMQD